MTNDRLCCGQFGPPPFPGAKRYLCSRERGHQGAHEAHNPQGWRLDSWPQDEEATR